MLRRAINNSPTHFAMRIHAVTSLFNEQPITGGVRISVTNQGDPIPMEILPRLFDRFSEPIKPVSASTPMGRAWVVDHANSCRLTEDGCMPHPGGGSSQFSSICQHHQHDATGPERKGSVGLFAEIPLIQPS